MNRRTPKRGAVWLAVVAMGCTGGIGDASSDPEPDGTPGRGGASGSGVSTGGRAGDGTAVLPPLPPPPPEFRPAPATLRRLTVRQYLNSMRDLLGPSVRLPTSLEPDVVLDGFASVGAARLSLSATATEQFESAALDLAQQAAADAGWRTANVPCKPAAATDDRCAREAVTAFGRRAWRRPLAPDELSRYAGIATSAAGMVGDFWRGLGWAVAGLLQSPHFLYRVELGIPDPASGARKRLDAYELGGRLSYLVWETTPDEMLLAAAASGQLASTDGLRAQAQRLLASPRARTALMGFFADRFRLDDLEDADHPQTAFPEMTATLLSSMRKETLAVADDIAFVRDADMRELLGAQVTFLNDDLARVYGLPRPGRGAELVKTTLPMGSPRVGYLGQGSFLALAAHATTTSPSRRGKLVREVLLCQTVPDPPADVEVMLPKDPPAAPRTMRQRLEIHRQDPTCAACHGLIDPIGLAFESFNAIGVYRTTEAGQRIDASGELDGAKFADAAGLARVLRDRPETSACLTRALFRYALGHVETDGEEPAIKVLIDAFAASGYKFRALVQATADSAAFRYVAAGAP